MRRRRGPGLRLSRRARRLSAVITLGVGMALGSWLGFVVAGDPGGMRLVGDRSVVVEPGDTVWSIAADVADPEDDVRAVVFAIQQLNDLDGGVIVPGRVLALP